MTPRVRFAGALACAALLSCPATRAAPTLLEQAQELLKEAQELEAQSERELREARAKDAEVQQKLSDAAFPDWRAYLRSLPPLRELPQDWTYVLRVLYLEDPRLPALSDEDRKALYGRVEALLRERLGYSVRLREARKAPLADYFAEQRPLFFSRKNSSMIRAGRIDLTAPDAERRVRRVVENDLRERPIELIGRHVPLPPGATRADAIETAVKTFWERNRALRGAPALDGKPFFDPAKPLLLSFPHWTALLTELREADFILTNSTIVDADAGMPIYVIGRGGLTNGMVENNAHNPYQAAGVVGLFPFLSDAPYIRQARGEIPHEERLDVIATFWLHELGHFFARAAELYDHPGCAHVAPPGLRYLDWHREIRAKRTCPLPHPKLGLY